RAAEPQQDADGVDPGDLARERARAGLRRARTDPQGARRVQGRQGSGRQGAGHLAPHDLPPAQGVRGPVVMGGLEMAPQTPQTLGSAPAKLWRSSIPVTLL